MRRLALHLLLIVTLILNGMSAPWAMARMSHDHASPAPDPAAVDAALATNAHAHHGQHAMADAAPASVPADHAAPTSEHDRPCCNGTSCACGCVMPPALSFFTRLPAPLPHAPFVFVFPAAHAMPGHDTPPFRPPAA